MPVGAAMTPAAEESVRASIVRGTPLGTDAWGRGTAFRLNLGYTLRGRGRPARP